MSRQPRQATTPDLVVQPRSRGASTGGSAVRVGRPGGVASGSWVGVRRRCAAPLASTRRTLNPAAEVRLRAVLNLIARAFSWLLLLPVVTMGLRTVVSAIGLGRVACRLGWHCWTPRWRDRSVGPRDGSELERRCATCGLLRPASS